jgi:hypothetical protein
MNKMNKMNKMNVGQRVYNVGQLYNDHIDNNKHKEGELARLTAKFNNILSNVNVSSDDDLIEVPTGLYNCKSYKCVLTKTQIKNLLKLIENKNNKEVLNIFETYLKHIIKYLSDIKNKETNINELNSLKKIFEKIYTDKNIHCNSLKLSSKEIYKLYHNTEIEFKTRKADCNNNKCVLTPENINFILKIIENKNKKKGGTNINIYEIYSKHINNTTDQNEIDNIKKIFEKIYTDKNIHYNSLKLSSKDIYKLYHNTEIEFKTRKADCNNNKCVLTPENIQVLIAAIETTIIQLNNPTKIKK